MPLFSPTYSTGVPSGAAFPTSPATNDFFHRTDRGITYYYDGTRWVSVFEKILLLPYTGAFLTATGTPMRAPNPEFGRDGGIYATRISYLFRTSAAATWRIDLSTFTGTVSALVISEEYVATTNERFGVAENVNAAIAATVDSFELDLVEVSGTADCFGGAALSYRLIG